MTDDVKATVVAPAARGALHRRGHRLIWISLVVAVLGLVLLGFVLVGFDSKVDALTTQVQQANSSAQENHVAAQQLYNQVQRLGGTPQAVPPGPTPATGPAGPAGRGITGTSIVGGHLMVSYTDNITEDKGQVVGKDGAAGTNGRGITGSTLADGHLILSYSDNTSQDIGQVVGAAGAKGDTGRSVKSMSSTNGHLIVTYDDNTTQDVGPLPAGPPGPAGPAGPACPDGYEQHEAVITANDGTKYDGVACVKPSTATTTTTPPPLLGNGKR